jgi:CBS domain-containing protein
MRIADVLQQKGNSVVTIAPEARVSELVAVLGDHNIGAAVVSTPAEQVAGIVSERDVVRHMQHGPGVLNASVSEIMTSPVRTASPDDSIEALMLLMTEHRIRHVPVVADGELRGLVSIGDVVKSRIGELEFERDQLSSYVMNPH